MSAHSPYAPSSAYRWVVCPGSVDLSALYPEEVDTHGGAEEGTAAHWAGAELLLGRSVSLGAVAPNGLPIDEDMLEGASHWVDFAQSLGLELNVEKRVSISRIHPDCFGTPDTWAFDKVNGVLHVVDFKYGHGYVDEVENWQLIAYTCGILDELGFDGWADQTITCKLTIVQPRYFGAAPVRTWTVKACDLRGQINLLHDAAHSRTRTLVTGSHCLHCPAAHTCTALGAAVSHAAEFLAKPVVFDLNPAQQGQELQLLNGLEDLIKARRTARAAEVERRLKNGEPVQGWALEPTYGRSEWMVSSEDLFALGDLMGVDLRKPAAPVTYNQAEKLFKQKGVAVDGISEYSHKPSKGLKLVRADKATNLAAKAFGVK